MRGLKFFNPAAIAHHLTLTAVNSYVNKKKNHSSFFFVDKKPFTIPAMHLPNEWTDYTWAEIAK